jgi:hypothetical protein
MNKQRLWWPPKETIDIYNFCCQRPPTKGYQIWLEGSHRYCQMSMIMIIPCNTSHCQIWLTNDWGACCMARVSFLDCLLLSLQKNQGAKKFVPTCNTRCQLHSCIGVFDCFVAMSLEVVRSWIVRLSVLLMPAWINCFLVRVLLCQSTLKCQVLW